MNQVPPFDATLDWPKEIAGVKLEHDVAWMKSAYWITATAWPAISAPAGFYRRWPARRHPTLQFARRCEQATNTGTRRPAIGL